MSEQQNHKNRIPAWVWILLAGAIVVGNALYEGYAPLAAR